MSKDMDRRLYRLEQAASPERILWAPDTLDNRALVLCGLLPDPPGAPPAPPFRKRKELRVWLDAHQPLEKGDTVIFLSEVEVRL